MSDEAREHQEDESQASYVRILSHQLKSPINSVQSLLNTITEGFTGETNSKTLYFIEKANKRIADAKEIIADLLDFQLYGQREIIFHEELDLVVRLHELADRYTSRASENGVSLHLDLPNSLKIFLTGDPRGLEHALSNLVENAIKYTPENGMITLTMGMDEQTKTCQIAIADTGYGIPESELEMIFEPFYRSMSHKSSIPGTGLGLAIVKRVIVQHGGSIQVTSQENAGTTFVIALPYTRIETKQEPDVPRKHVVIIGGVTAGPKVAARLRRLDEDVDITIIDKSEFLSYSGCSLPLYITDKLRSSRALMSTADNTIRDINSFETIENVTALNNTVALEIDRERKIVAVQNLQNTSVSEIAYDVLVLATGSEFVVPEIPGIDEEGIYSLHNLAQANAIKHALTQRNAQDVYIIGAGLVGTSMAESLIAFGARVTILEKQPHILYRLIDHNIALKVQRELQRKGVKVLTNIHITKIQRIKEHLHILTPEQTYHADLIILATGVRPNADLAAQAGLTIGSSGGIHVGKTLQTSDEFIYAAGDCAESLNLITQKPGYWPLGSVSTKMGRIAADNIGGRHAEFRGSLGTVMFKIIDTNVARTGLTLREAREHGFDAESVLVSGLDRAHYYENARYVILKVIADRATRVILGAQGYGQGKVVSKIQIFACAITQSMTLDDMFHLDLGYAPPFNLPVDLAQTACLVLSNKIEGLIQTVTVKDFEQAHKQTDGIIDVSPFSQHSSHFIPGSLNIPLENIRLEGLPFEKQANLIIYSNTSSGAYKACRYLQSKGYSNLRMLEGGYVCWER